MTILITKLTIIFFLSFINHFKSTLMITNIIKTNLIIHSYSNILYLMSIYFLQYFLHCYWLLTNIY